MVIASSNILIGGKELVDDFLKEVQYFLLGGMNFGSYVPIVVNLWLPYQRQCNKPITIPHGKSS